MLVVSSAFWYSDYPGCAGSNRRSELMKTLHWEKIWKEFDERIRFGSQWEDQKRIIVELVEKDRNEKPEERKRKTVK